MIPEGIEIRAARPEEEGTALSLVHTPPGPEAVGILGREDWAITLGDAVQAFGGYRSAGDTLLVATRHGEPVGMLLANHDGSGDFHLRRLPALLAILFRTLPLRELPGFLRRVRLRMQANLPTPDDSLHISELHVHPTHQGRGIGAALLARAEEIAGERGLARLSLSTLASNPARRLYTRQGYCVTAESHVAGYSEFTGATGRVRMEKTLGETEGSTLANSSSR